MLAADWPGKYVDETMKEAATEIRRLREEIENRPIGWGAFCDENEALRQQVQELKEALLDLKECYDATGVIVGIKTSTLTTLAKLGGEDAG
jgi:hypothetical protein